jgi:hypothetical protein
MHLSASTVPAEQIEIKMFAEGNGNGSANDSGEISLNIPDDMLIQHSADPLCCLIDFVYPDFMENMKKSDFFPRVWYTCPNFGSSRAC